MPSYTDPFSNVYEALWALLEEQTEFAALVRPGNRLKFVGTQDPGRRDTLADADTPHVRIVPGGLDTHLFRTSNGSSFTRQYLIEIRSNTKRLNPACFPVEWAIIRAVARAQDALAGLDGVRKVRVVSGQPPSADPDDRSDGWYSVVGVEVEYWTRTAELQTNA